MGSKVDRIGEKRINNFGSEMIITEYRGYHDIDAYFPKYDWFFKNADYSNFKKGKIKCPYERRYYGVGYLGEGKYEAWKNSKATRVYQTWHDMLKRCYDEKEHKRHLTYKDCNSSEKWLNFQNFGEWDSENYYEIEGQQMCLDKDILVKHNKIYSPNTCIYVPQGINKLFIKNDKKRGESVIGTSYHKRDKVYQVNCNLINPETKKSKNKYLGYYNTEVEAFKVYKYYKERNIKEVADYYKGRIPNKLYDALYNYEVDIND